MKKSLKNYSQNSYAKLKIGTNLLENVQRILVLDEMEPLVITKGFYPLVSMRVPLDGNGRNWKLIVRKSTTKYNQKITIVKKKKHVSISLEGVVLLSAFEESSGSLVVDRLDMRPVGLLFYLENDILFFGNYSFSKNNFRNLNSMITINTNKNAQQKSTPNH